MVLASGRYSYMAARKHVLGIGEGVGGCNNEAKVQCSLLCPPPLFSVEVGCKRNGE